MGKKAPSRRSQGREGAMGKRLRLGGARAGRVQWEKNLSGAPVALHCAMGKGMRQTGQSLSWQAWGGRV